MHTRTHSHTRTHIGVFILDDDLWFTNITDVTFGFNVWQVSECVCVCVCVSVLHTALESPLQLYHIRTLTNLLPFRRIVIV